MLSYQQLNKIMPFHSRKGFCREGILGEQGAIDIRSPRDSPIPFIIQSPEAHFLPSCDPSHRNL